ncbi:hypothetical protein Peur_014802 [Populus x canadensis]
MELAVRTLSFASFSKMITLWSDLLFLFFLNDKDLLDVSDGRNQLQVLFLGHLLYLFFRPILEFCTSMICYVLQPICDQYFDLFPSKFLTNIMSFEVMNMLFFS